MNNANAFNIAIAIDFGTTFSGYAYCFAAQAESGEIYKNTEWTKQVNQKHSYVKTPTQLLYKNGKLEAWGYQAKRRLIELGEAENKTNYCLFEKFKTEIFERKRTNKQGEPYIKRQGKKYFLVDLIADYLREIRLAALADIKNHTGADIDETRIRWCLTIPAIWDDAAKQLMEQASKKAGILQDGDWDTENFIFALEPEAASIYCLYVADKELGIVENEATMMVVDCGGGTVDLTVHKIIRTGLGKGVREVIPGSGAVEGHGGKDVDKHFLVYLHEVLGEQAVSQFESAYPEAYLDMLDDWESFKYGFDPDSYVRGNFRIPAPLRDLLLAEYPDTIAALAKVQNNNTYNLWLTREVMEQRFFGPVVDNIKQCIENVFSRMDDGCDYMYLVGGFSTSRYLQKALKAQFSAKVSKKILIPGEPGKSVMTGAASFARNPDMILPRKSRLTYGIASAISGMPAEILLGEFLAEDMPADINMQFKAMKRKHAQDPDISKLLTLAELKATEMGLPAFKENLRDKLSFDEENEVLDLNRHFTKFVSYGDTVVKNYQVPETFVQKSSKQQEVQIEIFATEKKDVLFVDEQDVDKVGEIILKLPPGHGEHYRKIGVTMFFGDTKLKIKAKCLASNNEVEAELNFLSMYKTHKQVM